MILDTLIPRVQFKANGVESNYALLVMRDVFREFLKRTKLWKATITVDAVADQDAYALATTSEVDAGEAPVIHRIEEVKLNGAEVSSSGYTLRTSDGYLVFESGYIPSEDLTDGIVVKVRLVPTWDGIDFPQHLVETYVDAIVSGALAELFSTANRPYTDPVSARKHRLIFSNEIVQARIDLDSEGTERAGNLVASSKNSGGLMP